MNGHAFSNRLLGVSLVIVVARHAAMQGEVNAAAADEVKVNFDSGRSLVGLPEWSPDTIIVKFDPNLPQQVRLNIMENHQCAIRRSCNSGDFHLVAILSGETPRQVVEKFGTLEGIEYAELNYYAYSTFVPNDPLYPLQWHLDSVGMRGIHMVDAWSVQRGRPDVIVAVLDTGVAFEDYDAFKQASDLVDTPFVPGYDFVDEDDHPNDDQGHGTHVTGTIAQSTNNGTGVAGVAFGCSIMPVKILDHEGLGTYFNIARGILFAVENGASVINMSFAGRGDSKILRDAVAAAYEQGVTCVCAGGNDYVFGSPVSYPAGYDEFCIGVAAVRYDRGHSWYSTAGTYIDVAAPGGDLSVDQNGDGLRDGVLQQTFLNDPNDFAYWFFQGTSMATPHVSGLAALLVARGVTRPDKIAAAIENTAEDLGPAGWDQEYGWGIINAKAALAYRVLGDSGADNVVDAGDLMAFCSLWLEEIDSVGKRLDSDFNCDHRVDFSDFAVLANNWDQQ